MAAKKAVKKAAKKAPAKKTVAKRTAGSGIDPDSTYGQRLARRTEENLTPAMKHRRDVFIQEYLYDFIGAQAWRRMKARVDPDDHKPYSAEVAAEQAYMMLNEPYVALKVRETIDAMEEGNMLSRQRVLGMAIREAEFQGFGAKHAGRVGAVKLLMDYLKMTSGAEAAGNRGGGPQGASGGPRGGVMVVPGEVGVDQWEAKAMGAQARLKEDVKK